MKYVYTIEEYAVIKNVSRQSVYKDKQLKRVKIDKLTHILVEKEVESLIDSKPYESTPQNTITVENLVNCENEKRWIIFFIFTNAISIMFLLWYMGGGG